MPTLQQLQRRYDDLTPEDFEERDEIHEILDADDDELEQPDWYEEDYRP